MLRFCELHTMTCTLKNTAATNSKKGKDLELYHQGPPAHSELIFVRWLRDKGWVSVFYIWILSFLAPLLRHSFPLCDFSLCEIQLAADEQVCFRISVPLAFESVVLLWAGSMSCSLLCGASLWLSSFCSRLLCFHINIRVGFSICGKGHGILMGIAL